MEEFELFDLGFEGTTIRDSLRFRREGTFNAIVFDSNNSYGSTYHGYSGLKKSKYIDECVLNKGTGDARLLLEAFPAVFRPTDRHIPELQETGMMEFLHLIKIQKHFYVDPSGKTYRIPYTKTEIADSDALSLKEKNLVGRLLNGKLSLEELYESLSENTREVLTNGVVCDGRNHGERMARYMRNFGDVPFLYPQHGLKEISEMFSRCNSMCGAGYVLDSALVISNKTKETLDMFSLKQKDGKTVPPEYMHRIDTSYGTIFTKRIIRAENKELVSHVRAINTEREVLAKTFFAFVQRETTSMKVIGLSSDTECCPEGTYLTYVIKADEPVTEEDLKLLHVEEKGVIEDISYQTKFSFEFDSLDE
uniref:Rab gdp dissociation inhibitor n=1 Tax=Encephalitozoon cuniculi TaxID=6035 RepID=M1KI49_ENCCN|nr:rab gdp dissociation inhibitor [Encephalitozoon cuniculi]